MAKAEVAAAEAQVKATETDIERLTIRALVPGQILQVNIRPGEFAPAGVLQCAWMLLGNVDRLHVRVDIDENDAWRVRRDAPAVAFVRGNRDVIVAGGQRFLDPGDIRLLAMERACHGVHQHGEGRPAPQATRLPQREEALDPAIALLVVAAMHHPAPEYGEPQGPLGPIIGGLHPGFHHERPQGPHLPLQRAGKRPGFVRSRTVLVQQPDHPRIPGLHIAGGRRYRGPVDQPLQLGQHSAAKPGQLRVLPLRESPCAADQMAKQVCRACSHWQYTP